MPFSRRRLLAGAAGAALAVALPLPSLARAPLGQAPLPGAVRRRIGDVEVTALLDGYLEMPPELFLGADAETAAKLALDQFQAPLPRRSPVNAYLVNLGSRLVLVDAGAAGSLGPTLGRLPDALAAAGVSPSQVDAVLLSHMHPDHIAGAVTPAGEAAFPNAEMIVTEDDYAYWHDDANLNQAPEAAKPFFLAARSAAAAYAGRLTRIRGEAEILGPIRAVPLPGHTPGHTGYMVESGGEALFIWADALHHAAYQFARPDWSAAFDIDPRQAASMRRRALDRAAADRLLVAGMHLPFPGFGHVAREGEGYRYVPTEWPYAL